MAGTPMLTESVVPADPFALSKGDLVQVIGGQELAITKLRKDEELPIVAELPIAVAAAAGTAAADAQKDDSDAPVVGPATAATAALSAAAMFVAGEDHPTIRKGARAVLVGTMSGQAAIAGRRAGLAAKAQREKRRIEKEAAGQAPAPAPAKK